MARVLAALDVGSGATKILVCRAETTAGFKLQEVLLERETEVLLASDVKEHGQLSESVMQKCAGVLLEYKALAEALGATSLGGVGTQVFRSAPNGAGFLDRMRKDHDINVQLVSQEQEGAIGFATACALAGEPLTSPDLVSWDSGAASFQLAHGGGGKLAMGRLGSSIVSAMLVGVQGRAYRAGASPNPVQRADLANLQSEIRDTLHREMKVTEQTREMLRTGRIVAIGGATSAFNLCRLAVAWLPGAAVAEPEPANGAVISRPAVKQALDSALLRTDADMERFGFVRELQPDLVVPKLCLVHSVMEFFDIDSFKYYESTGSCLGVLALEFNRSPSSSL